MEYGCIGEKLGHSFSKDLHKKIGDYRYDLKEIEKENLKDFILKKDFKGINVTVPYKVEVIPYLEEIDGKAKKIGAVNTVVNRNGQLYGYNTDFDGLKALILKNGIEIKGAKVLILGSGGTSRTAHAVAENLEAKEIITVGRTAKLNSVTYKEAYTNHSDAEIIINTTPCGMYPETEGIPIDIDRFPNLRGLVDVVYNPLRTRLVLKAQQKGIKAAGGLYMLVAQAFYGAEKFFSKPCDKEKAKKVFDEISNEKENIVLIGMPGCGKTTVGEILSQNLNKKFIDTDELIKEKSGKSPAEIINDEGIDSFRKEESQIIKEISSFNGCIIATGGGAVLDSKNAENLKLNGRIFFIDRPIENITPTADRPLSDSTEKLKAVFKERYSIYKSSADEIIENSGTAYEAAELIKKVL